MVAKDTRHHHRSNQDAAVHHYDNHVLEYELERRVIPVLEKLIRTHPVWYLPNLSRRGAEHLLQNRDEGVSTL